MLVLCGTFFGKVDKNSGRFATCKPENRAVATHFGLLSSVGVAWWSTTSRSNRESQEVVRLNTVNLTVTQSDLPVVLGFGWPIQVN